MSYTSFKQAILLLAASELLLAKQAESAERINAAEDTAQAAEARAALCAVGEGV